MIETVVKEILEAALDAPVFLEMPELDRFRDRPFVLLMKTGSGRSNGIERATLAVQSYAPSLYETACLNEAVKAALDAAGKSSARLFAAKLNSDYEFTDTENRRYRYQAVYDLYY